MAHACYVCTFYPVPDGEGVECPHCHRLQYGNACPRCGQNAPTIIKNLRVVCSSCGVERGPLAGGMPMNIAGKPSQLGGVLASVFGWGVVAGSVALSLLAMLMFVLHWTLLGVPLALMASFGVLLAWWILRRGKGLSTKGDTASRHAREQAMFAFAASRGGMVTATEVAAALNVQLAEADAMLTAMAREGTHVGIEVDGAGVVHYVFRAVRAAGTGANASAPVRVDAGVAQPTAEQHREQIRAQVDQEFERMQKASELQKRQG